MVEGERPLARHRLRHWHSGGVDQSPQRIGGLRVDDPAAGHEERAPRAPDARGRLGEDGGLRRLARDPPGPRLEESLGIVERLGLHVLRQRQGGHARFGLVGQHAHRLGGCGEELLGAAQAAPEPGHRPQRVVHRDVGGAGDLELLENRVGPAARERVARQKEHGQAVDRRARRGRDHVRRPRSDRRGAGPGLEPVLHPGVAGGRVNHCLLVSREHVRKDSELVERLADPGDVPMSEDPPHPREEWTLDAVPLDALGGHPPDQRLRHRQPHRAHDSRLRPGALLRPAAVVIGTRGSRGSASHEGRTHACAGSSVNASDRSAPGPARTFR